MNADASEVVGAAAEAASGAGQAVPGYSWTAYFMGLALMFVMLALLWLGARLMRRQGALRLFGQTAALNVESRLSLGPRKQLLVVKYRGRRLLLGVTEQQINLLQADPPEEDEAGEEPAPAPTLTGENASITGKFKDMLHDLNKRK